MDSLYNLTTVNNLTEQKGAVGKIVRWIESQLAKTRLGGAMRGKGYKAAFDRVNQELPFTWYKPLQAIPSNVPIKDIWRTIAPGTKDAQKGVVKDYLLRLSPVPNKAVKEILKSAGLGPAIAAFGYGLFLRWAALALLITWCRFLITIFASFAPEQISEWIEKNLGIKEWEYTSSDLVFTNIIKNLCNSIYLPDVFFTIPGYIIVPYITAAVTYITTKTGRSEGFVEHVVNVHDRIKSSLMSIVGMSKEIPEDLLNQFPPSERGNVKMDDTSIYWKTPDYPIQNLGESSRGRINLTSSGDDYAMLIPGDGWYRIKDIDF